MNHLAKREPEIVHYAEGEEVGHEILRLRRRLLMVGAAAILFGLVAFALIWDRDRLHHEGLEKSVATLQQENAQLKQSANTRLREAGELRNTLSSVKTNLAEVSEASAGLKRDSEQWRTTDDYPSYVLLETEVRDRVDSNIERLAAQSGQLKNSLGELESRLDKWIAQASAPVEVPVPATAAQAPQKKAGIAAPAEASASNQKGPADITVWVNTGSGVYHCPGTRWYGATKQGAYMTQKQAQDAGNRPAYGKACE
jgi:type II secretory pathway component PulM